MGRVLIVRIGDRTEHRELQEGSLTIGREASCDLCFADSRLSRHHAKLEVTPHEVRLVDLDSLNGTWINGERVQEKALTLEDVVSMGRMQMSLESTPPTRTRDDSDVPQAPLHLVPLNPSRPILTAEEADTFPGPTSSTADLDQTIPLALPLPIPPPRRKANLAFRKLLRHTASWPWATKFYLIVAGIAFVSYFALAVPLVGAMRSSLKDESLLRARALLRYLAADNEVLLAEQKLRELSLDRLLQEPGVKDALILDLDGKILAPSVRAGELLLQIEGIQTKTPEIYTFYLGHTGSGHYNLVLPLIHRGRRVGIGVLTYSIAGRGSVAVELILGFLVIAAATAGAVVAAKRMTMNPMATLTDDVESVIKTDADFVDSEQPYRELGALAESINRLIERVVQVGDSEAESLKKAVNAEEMRIETPSVDGSPSPSGLHPTTCSGAGLEAGQGLVVNEGYIVTSADAATVEVLQTPVNELVGKHLLEAIRDQELVESVLDLISTVADGVEISERVENQNVKLSVTRNNPRVFIKLERT
jgi:hypothetical protein